MLHAQECIFFAAQRLECLTFQVQKILFRCGRWACHVASAYNVRQLSRNVRFVICNKAGLLHEVFGTGTAATISLIKELRYKDFVMQFDVENWKTGPTIKKWLNDIREGRREDKYNWMWKV